MDSRRSDPRVARRVVNSIFDGAPADARQSYCKFLGASIAYLAEHHPDRWGITLHEDKGIVRLNAGMGVECLILSPGWLRVLVHKGSAPMHMSFDGRTYASAPGCQTVAIRLPEIARSLPRIADAHHKALGAVAARRRPFRSILNAHSTGVTRWLSQVLGREVPNPADPATPLHIVQGGIENGDKAQLERLARGGKGTRSWIAPKAAVPGDEVVIYIGGFGFFATGRVQSRAKPRGDWTNRYGTGLNSITLIQPPVSLPAIRRSVPDLTWAIYPRSITTPPPEVAEQVRALIRRRRQGKIDLDESFVESASLDELRAIALGVARSRVPVRPGTALYRTGSAAIRRYVLARANGRCEACGAPAPFRGGDGRPFLEAHHTMRLADDGPDHPEKVIGVCPNCHKRAHLAEDARSFNESLIRKLRGLKAAR